MARGRAAVTIEPLRLKPTTPSRLADEAAVQAALLPAAILSKDYEFLSVNRTLCDLVDLTTRELRRLTLFDIVQERERESFRDFTVSLTSARTSAPAQREVHLVTGAPALCILRRLGHGSTSRVVINLVDLSDLMTPAHDRAILIRQIEEAASDWRRTFDAVEMPIIVVGAELLIRRINRAARMLVGKSYAEIIGTSIRELPHAEPWLTVSALVREVQENRAPAARQVRDGAGRTLDVLAMMFNAEDAADARVIVIAWDVSALVDLQSRLEQQRQMAAMGSLVAGVAHEVRNPLFAISATVDAMEQAAGPDLREYFEVLREEIDRMTALMNDLLAYGRPSKPIFQETPVKQIMELAARGSSAVAARQNVTVTVEAPDDVTVVADRDRLARALENLVLNAVQHSPSGSNVALRCLAELDGKTVMARIIVRDRGRGFTPEDLPRVFEPFFSRRKGGTGLGLALVDQIVTEHGGQIVVANGAGGGAEVAITMPARRS